MAEGTYEYECMRAELLGIDPPDRETFEANRKAQLEAEQENLASEQAKVEENDLHFCELSSKNFTFSQELEHQDEQLRGGHGKLDELNSILSMTQQRITKFKVRKLFGKAKIRSTFIMSFGTCNPCNNFFSYLRKLSQTSLGELERVYYRIVKVFF